MKRYNSLIIKLERERMLEEVILLLSSFFALLSALLLSSLSRMIFVVTL